MKDRLNNYGLVTSVAVATLLSLGMVSSQSNTVKADTQVPITAQQKNESVRSNMQKDQNSNSVVAFSNSNANLKDQRNNSQEKQLLVNNSKQTKATLDISSDQVESTNSQVNSTEKNTNSQLNQSIVEKKTVKKTNSNLDVMHEGMADKNGYSDNGYTYVDPSETSPERKASYHMTTDQGWSNDLQTIIYDSASKEYRLYFLHSADGATNPFGPQGQNWNEADSKDLIHFSKQVDALPATSHEYANNKESWKSAWTGSVIKNNGLIAGVPKGAYVTYFSGLKQSDGSQNIWAAWSDDNGKTFKHVLNEGNPVLDHSWDIASKDPGQERDAGVFYYNGKMIMYAAEGDKLGAYQSHDGITWTTADPNGASKVGGGSAMPGFTSDDIPLECPAIRFMKNGNGETKAVLFLGGKMPQNGQTTGTYYTVGHLDPNGLFANETGVQRLDLGSDYYGANFSGSVDSTKPSDSIISMGWVGNWSYTSSGIRASQQYTATSGRLGSYSLPRKLVLNADNTISSTPITTDLEERNKNTVTQAVAGTVVDNSDNYGYHNVIDLKKQPVNSKYIVDFSTKDGSKYQGAIKITFKQGKDYNEFIYDPITGKVRQRGFSSELTAGASDYYKNGLYYNMGYVTDSGLKNQKNIPLTIYTDKNSVELFFPNGKAYTVARFCVNNIQDLKIQSQSGNGNEYVTVTSSEVGPELVGYNTVNSEPTTPDIPVLPDQPSDQENISNVPAIDSNTVVTSEGKVVNNDNSNIALNNQTAVEKEILHNSYVYDANGQRVNDQILRIGLKVNTYGEKVINGIPFLAIDNHHFIKANNVNGVLRKLSRTSFVYNKYGKRIKKIVLRKGKKIRTYGKAITIKHKKFYIIGKGEYVKMVNFIIADTQKL